MTSRALLLAVLTSSCLLACTAFEDSRPPEKIVEERAGTYLRLLFEQEWEEALQYTSPGFRSKTTPEQLSRKYGGVWMWQEVWIGDVECDEGASTDRCVVQTFKSIKSPHYDGVVEDYRPKTWIKVDGQWFAYER